MKSLSLTVILFISILFTFGQDKQIFIGVDAGPSIISLRNVDNKDLKSKVGYAAGLSFEYFLNEKLGIKSGLLFEKKGAKDELTLIDEEGTPTGTIDIDNQYNYLILPLLFAYHTPGDISFYANAGPYFGLLLSNMVYYEETDSYPGQKEDFTSETNTIDFGLSLGIGTNITLSEDLLLGVDIKNNLGFTKTIGSSKTNSLGLLIGLKYKL